MNILLVEYPGYSVYDEEKSSNIVLEDSLLVFDFLRERMKVDSGNIFVFGRSIGSGPATYLCSQRDPAALCLMSPFTSIQEVAKNLVGVLKVLIADKFPNREHIKSVKCPILIIHGIMDNLIPYEQSQELIKNIKCPYEAIFPEDMDHNYFNYDIDLIMPLKDFLYRHTDYDEEQINEEMFDDSIFYLPNQESDI